MPNKTMKISPSPIMCAIYSSVFLVLVIFIGGCTTAAALLPAAADAVASLTGLKKDGPAPDRDVNIRVIAAENLNLNENRKALSVVVKLYRLKDMTAFTQLTPEIASSGSKEKDFLKTELAETREQVFIPKQEYTFAEKIPSDVRYIGIAGLFRSPDPKRWKIVIPVADIDKKVPLTIGIHACALSISDGLPPEKNPYPASTLAATVCK